MSLFGNKTIYFIDSENVNDNWIDTITDIKKSDEIRVFYTEKSNNVSCENISKIAGGEVNLNWIKCFTGQNALDFQLVTDLGYSIAKGMRDTFVIISNDKGYDAVVNYWVIKGVSVSRVGVETKVTKKSKRSRKAKLKSEGAVIRRAKTDAIDKPKEAIRHAKSVDTKSTEAKSHDKPKAVRKVAIAKRTADTQEEIKKYTPTQANPRQTMWTDAPASDEEYVEAVGRCVSVEKLNHYHMVLTNLFGQEKGTIYYHSLKDDKELKGKIARTYISDKSLRLDYMIKLFLAYNNKEFTDARAIMDILQMDECKDLNEFYKYLTKQFTEKNGRVYYNMYKGVFTILRHI